MAHPVEPMDIDNIDSDFDNKENTFHHNNVQPCTEKGYEELDVSELNMRLRYSVTPASSPMSKSYTSYVDNKSLDSDDSLNITVSNNLTRSLNATITKSDNVVKTLKSLPLQSLPTDQSVERNASVLRQLDSTITVDNNNVTVTVSDTNDIDENLSMPSSSSSAVPTPEATTPTKEIPKNDGGSPIMRGLKSVLNMFRSSQSPIPPPDHENNTPKQLTPTPTKRLACNPTDKVENKPVLASTPISTHRERDTNGSKRNSPLKDSITFNDDLEKELQWKDETTILFSQEKIPIHKLFYPHKQNKVDVVANEIKTEVTDNFDTTVEYMDISYNDSQIKDSTMTEVEQEITKNDFHVASESDSEFLDCETESNATKTESYLVDNKVAELIKEETVEVQKAIKDVSVNQENQEILQEIETKKELLNVTDPLANVTEEKIIENKLFTTINQNENIAITNKTYEDILNTTESNFNITKEGDCNAQPIETQNKKYEITSEPNLDVTLTMDDEEKENKLTKNIFEVSTLESHTKSLSSLIESLDVTKSFEEEKAKIEANHTFNVTATFNQDTVNLEASHLEIKAGKPAEIKDAIPNLNALEGFSEVKNFLETDALKLCDGMVSSTEHNSKVAINLDKEEEVISKSGSNSLENNADTVLNIQNESIKDVFSMPTSIIHSIQDIPTHEPSELLEKTLAEEATSSAQDTTFDISKDTSNVELINRTSLIQPVQEITSQETSQVFVQGIGVETLHMTESPADAPLPEDDEIEEDMNLPTGTVVLASDNVPLKVENRTVDTKVDSIAENTINYSLEANWNDSQVPDMLLATTNCNKENIINSPDEIENLSDKERVIETKNVSLEVDIVPDSHQEIQNDVAINAVKNICSTFDVHAANVNQSVDSTQILPDVINQSMNDVAVIALAITDSQSIDTTGKEINIETNVSINCDLKQNIVENNIESTILPENQMDISISMGEEILDKNREISEMFLTEQKIDKLQHASDVALSCQEMKSESLLESQNTNPNEVHSNINSTFKKDIMEGAHLPEANTDSISKIQDANNTITLDKEVDIALDEKKINSEEEKNNTEDIETEKVICKENANIIVKSEEGQQKQIDLLKPCNIEQDIVQSTDNNIIALDEINELVSNVTSSIKDVTMSINDQKDVATYESKLEGSIRTVENGKEDGKKSSELNLNDGLFEKLATAIAEDEVLVSENNSPYVSVAADLDKISEQKPLENFEEIDIPIASITNIPSSPPITSKGYNFNFDEIDDPFATKVKIRMSPTPDSPEKNIELQKEDISLPKVQPLKKDINKNRRRSQPAKHKSSNTKKALNASTDGRVSVSEVNKNQIKTAKETQQINVVKEEKQITEVDSLNDTVAVATIKCDTEQNISENIPDIKTGDVSDADLTNNMTLTEDKPNDISMREENKDSLDSVTATRNEIKTTSSSEQSTYYSAGTSSSDSMKSRNVFNLPEIDDMNFNPFATKSKMRQTPPRDVDINNPFATKSKVMNSPDSSMILQKDNEDKIVNTTINTENKCTETHLEDKMETEPMEKDTSVNISNTTTSSNAADKDITIREINTEDEDTIEGPFLEAEDLEDKQSDLDDENVDMMQFNDLPIPEHDENADGELFIDAEAFEFLLNQNKTNVVADSGKESLFLKFDPLFAKRMSSDTVVAALSRAQKRQSTPTRTPRQQRNLPKSLAGSSAMNLTFDADPITTTEATEDVNTTVTKPMMVVTPAVNPTPTLRKSVTPTRSNRRSITFTSPAMAVIDRLLSLSANNSFAEQEAAPQVSREQNEAELALTQLREVLAEKEIHVYNLRSESKELKDRLSTLESQMKHLENEGQERLKKINDLNEKLSEKTQMNKSMAVVVEEYERTIASLIAETEQDKKRHAEERIALMNERDEQTAHLASMEVSFNDLHSKYEKSKQVIMNYKTNEESYKQSLKEFEENVSKMQKNYELLKQHATSKLNHANDELQKINRSHEAEVLKLNAMIKRKELHITSLEETLAQKTKANEELTAICDELINKVG